MVRSDDDRAFCRNIAQTLHLGTKTSHQEWCQERTQSPVWEVVEHGSNLVAIARYDTI